MAIPEGHAAASRAPADEGEWLAAIVESSDDAILSKDRDTLITSWNPAAERIYGYTAAEAIGRPVSILVPARRAGEEREIIARVLSGERVDHYETERVTKDGREIVVSLSVSPLRDSSSGEVVGAAVIARDVTRRHRARRLAARLQAVTSALSRELDAERVIDVALELITPAIEADAGVVGMVDGDEVALAGSVGHAADRLAAWQRFPLTADLPIPAAIRSGEPVWVASRAELAARYSGFAGVELTHGALAVVPLAGPERPFGALALSFESDREFDPEQQRAFIIAATQQAAYALVRARHYEEQRLTAERQRFLAEAGELLAGSLDPETTLRRLAELAVARIAEWCSVHLVDDDDLRAIATTHAEPRRAALVRELRARYPPDPDSPRGLANVVRTGRSELYREIDEDLLAAWARDPVHLELLRRLGLRSAMIVPLRARGRVLGALTLASSDPGRRYDAEQLALAEDLGRRAGLAVDNAILFRREHEAALTLQRAMLPQSLPELPGLEFHARYEPATAGLEVGGDWYEVVALDDGTVGVTVGDVAGRGIRAASVMGRVRPALRAHVLDGHRPREVVARLDRMIKELGGTEMTTVFHLHFEPASGRARYVRAGHPPALVRLAGGEVVELAGEVAPPLGILDDVECHEQETELPSGSLLLLYTDGLIERREIDIATGLERLKRCLAVAPGAPRECIEWLRAELGSETMPDDVAMLAMAVA